VQTGNIVTALVVGAALMFAVAHCIVVLNPRESFYTLGHRPWIARTIAIATVLVLLFSAIVLANREYFGYEFTLGTLLMVGFDLIVVAVCELTYRKIGRLLLSISYTTLFFLLTSIMMLVIQRAVIAHSPESATIAVGFSAWFVIFMAFMSLVSASKLLHSYIKMSRLI
jgi:hypothetical protein